MEFIDLSRQQEVIRVELENRIKGVLNHGTYIMGSEVKELEERLAAVRTASAGEDADAIEMSTNDLLESAQKIGQHMYAQAAAPAPDAKSGPETESDSGEETKPSEDDVDEAVDEDDIEDADFRESD